MEQESKKEPKYIKVFIIIILVIGAGLILYAQTEKFFAERELALQIEIQQSYDLGVEKGEINLYNEWKNVGRQEIIDNIANQLLNTGQVRIVDDNGVVKVILIIKPNEPAEPTE